MEMELAMVIKANTFIGNGSEPSVLVIQPTWERTVQVGFEYAKDAEEIARFLRQVFCTKTLNELKKIL